MSKSRKRRPGTGRNAQAVSTTASPSTSPSPRFSVVFVCYLVLAFLVYWPAIHGTFLNMDDTHYIVHSTRVTGRSFPWGFWIHPEQDWWPIHYTTLWAMWQSFGANTTAFHTLNILLHAINATLLMSILRLYRAPFAPWAGAIFIAHPVLVPGVAWIFQLKTVLSASFFLLAYFSYLRFEDQEDSKSKRPRLRYMAALFCALLAMLSKTTAVMLPVSLLLHHLWRRKTSVSQTLRLIAPFFAISAVCASVTLWLSASNASEGRLAGLTWHPSTGERVLVSAKNLWFYLGKTLIPTNTSFVYPWSSASPSHLSSYLYLLGWTGALAGVIVLWRRRPSLRPALALLLFYIINLLPALGFVTIPYMRYALVADHWQYLSSLASASLFALGISTILSKLSPPLQWIRPAAAALLVAVLATGSWIRAHAYANSEYLWTSVLRSDPTSVVARYNLGAYYGTHGRSADAETAYRKILRTRENHVGALVNLSVILIDQGKAKDATVLLRRALSEDPTRRTTLFALGNAYRALERFQDASLTYKKLLDLYGQTADLLSNLCSVQLELGQRTQAESTCRAALRIDPIHFTANYNLGAILLREERFSDAIGIYRRLSDQHPRDIKLLLKVAAIALRTGNRDLAISTLRTVLSLNPGNTSATKQLSRLGGIE